MAITKFNSVTGFSVGDLDVFDVIDGNANIFANAFSANTSNLGDVGNITILGGSNRYTLSTDGSGNLSWQYTGTGNANVAGSNSQIQYNDGTNLGASSNLTFDTTSNTLNVTNIIVSNTANITGNMNITGDINVSGNISGSIKGNVILLGLPVDTNLQVPGVVTYWTDETTVTDAIDDLNETIENVRNNTYVKSTSFTANPTAGGAGTSIALTISSVGNPNRYDVNWGDGVISNALTSSTPSHVYATNVDSPFTVTVRSYNSNGTGAGSSASSTRNSYIIIYTADPIMGFNLYRASTGGVALSGNTLYASEGETIYLENITTNTANAGANPTYTINWGDGTTDTISSNSVAGGVGGGRKSHTYATGQNSGTGVKTITLTLTAHSTANPASIPRNTTSSIKVYDPGISAPNGLSTKTITFSGGVGTSPYLASGFANNTGGATTYTAGASVNRLLTGNANSVTMTSYAYNADNGNLSAYINGVATGTAQLSSSDNSGTTNALIINSESDYNLLDASGVTTTFASSIYQPLLYKGFKATVSTALSGLSAGVSNFKLVHSITGNTNIIEFVKDDVSAVPTVDLTNATLSNATNGTYRYISGIPYYNTGSPTISLNNANIYDWIGQTYQNTTTPFQIEPATNDESTSGNVILSQTKTYSNLDGSTTFLSSSIPKANTGKNSGSPYRIGNQTISITTANVASVQTIKFLATNVNGNGAYSTHAKKIQVFTATPTGFIEDSIPCSIGSINTVAKRIVINGTGATRAYNSSTNYYTSALWTGAQTIAGTDSAVVRWNTLKNFTTNLSTGYLPAGPDLATGRSGTQYFFGAFSRIAKSSFTVTITGKLSGLYIAAPGTDIDTASSENGWLDASKAYNGSGVPGANAMIGGTNGCAVGTNVPLGSTITNQTYTLTLGTVSTTDSTGNQVLFCIALAAGDSITSWSFA